MISTTYSNFFYTTSDFKIYASKNLTNFNINKENLKQMITNLTKLNNQVPGNTYTEYFNGMKDDRKSAYFNRFISRGNRNNSINALINETHQLLHSCADKLSTMYEAAVYEFNSALNYENTEHQRFRRGLPFIGEILSEISDLPSPSAWLNELQLRKDLSEAVKGNIGSLNHIRHEIVAEHGVLEKLVPIVNDLMSNESDINGYFDINLDLFRDFTYITRVCMQGTAYANRLLNESRIISSIHKNALLNRPDEALFPYSKISEHIQNFHMTSTNLDPISHKASDILLSTTAITGFEKSSQMLHSILSVPICDFTNEFHFLLHPTLTTDDMYILRNLEHFALKKLDYFGCSRTSIMIFSSKDLHACKKIALQPQKPPKYICYKREVSMPSAGDPCANFNLQGPIALELTPSLILIKTNLTSVKIICPNSTHDVKIEALYSKIKVPTKCKLIGDGIRVGAYNSDILTHLDPSEIETLKIDPIEVLFITPIHKSVKKLEQNNTKLSTNLTILNDDYQKSKVILHKLDSDSIQVNHVLNNYSPMIFIYTAVSAILTIIVVKYSRDAISYLSRKKSSKKNKILITKLKKIRKKSIPIDVEIEDKGTQGDDENDENDDDNNA